MLNKKLKKRNRKENAVWKTEVRARPHTFQEVIKMFFSTKCLRKIPPPVNRSHILKNLHVLNDFWQLLSTFKVQSGLTKTNGHNKPELKFNSTFTPHLQEMITTESFDKCRLVWVTRETLRIRIRASAAVHTHPDTHKCVGTHDYTSAQRKISLALLHGGPLDGL